MNLSILAIVIIGQIAVFQFASVAFTRSLFAVTLGDAPESVSSAAAVYVRKAARARFIVGAVLLSVIPAIIFGPSIDPGVRKLLIAFVSVTSSVWFAIESVRDRRTARSLADTLPGSGMRRATLRPRSASHWYHPLWEGLPIAIVVATCVLTTSIGFRLGRLPIEMWVLQSLQVGFVVGTLFYKIRYGGAIPNVSSRLATLRDRPQLALAFAEQLTARENQYFMVAKIGVALLLGVSTIRTGLAALHHGAEPAFGGARWAIVGVLLLAFAGYVLQVAILTKQMQRQAESANGS